MGILKALEGVGEDVLLHILPGITALLVNAGGFLCDHPMCLAVLIEVNKVVHHIRQGNSAAAVHVLIDCFEQHRLVGIGWRVVDANLASVLKVEGRKSPEREIFTDEQVTLILSQKNTPTGQMVIALLACGVRIYELLHFKHEDFHRTESGAYLIGGCKTEAGRNRIIPILDFGIPVFEHAYATSVENGPLFPNGKGDFWNEKNWRNRKFYPFLEEIVIQPNPYDENGKRKPEFTGKLATYTPYTTRHTYASLCDRAGVNKDILKRAVGHTPKSQTLDEVYLHPKATQMIEAFDKANQLVNDEVLTTTKA